MEIQTFEMSVSLKDFYITQKRAISLRAIPGKHIWEGWTAGDLFLYGLWGV
jgi:hypothetical protein